VYVIHNTGYEALRGHSSPDVKSCGGVSFEGH